MSHCICWDGSYENFEGPQVDCPEHGWTHRPVDGSGFMTIDFDQFPPPQVCFRCSYTKQAVPLKAVVWPCSESDLGEVPDAG